MTKFNVQIDDITKPLGMELNIENMIASPLGLTQIPDISTLMTSCGDGKTFFTILDIQKSTEFMGFNFQNIENTMIQVRSRYLILLFVLDRITPYC